MILLLNQTFFCPTLFPLLSVTPEPDPGVSKIIFRSENYPTTLYQTLTSISVEWANVIAFYDRPSSCIMRGSDHAMQQHAQFLWKPLAKSKQSLGKTEVEMQKQY